METSPSKEEIKNFIIKLITEGKPENVQTLKQLMLQQHSITAESTTEILIQLEKEGKLHFAKPEISTPTSAKEYIFSLFWYWGIIALSIVTTISIFTISEVTYPVAYLRTVLGLIFVLFLPGYAFIKALFPTTVPIKTNSENLDSIERIVLSIGMSLTLVPIMGLVLYYTPWGIQLTSITLSLLALTTVGATVAVLREHQTSCAKSESPRI